MLGRLPTGKLALSRGVALAARTLLRSAATLALGRLLGPLLASGLNRLMLDLTEHHLAIFILEKVCLPEA